MSDDGEKLQNIFNRVIVGDCYIPHGSHFMCWALMEANNAFLINNEAYLFARQKIKEYLKEFPALHLALLANNLPSTCNYRLDIYKDWKNRPQLNFHAEQVNV